MGKKEFGIKVIYDPIIELEPFKIETDGTKLYEIHVKPSAPEHQIRRHRWQVRYWVSAGDLAEIKSTTIMIAEYHDEPWEFMVDGIIIKGILLDENVVSNVQNS
jgi:hypothetical protein